MNKTNLWAEGLMSWNATTFSSWQKTKKIIEVLQLASHPEKLRRRGGGRRTNGVKETSSGVGTVHDLAEYTRLIRSRHFFSRSKFDKTGFRFQSLLGGFGLWMKLSVQEVVVTEEHLLSTYKYYEISELTPLFLFITVWYTSLFISVTIWKIIRIFICFFSLTTHMRYCNFF